MEDHTTEMRQRILAMMPGLNINEFQVNRDGLMNDVAIVNDEWVFRFPKSESLAGALETEVRILNLIRPYLSVNVPTPVYRSRDRMVYRLVRGEPLTRRLVLGLDTERREHVARQLGRFLRNLHAVPPSSPDGALPATRAPVTRERWLDLSERIRTRVYPLLLPHQIRWAENLLSDALDDAAFFEYNPAIIHGDLAPYHILYDAEAGGLSGVIDFGVAGIGDPASDVGTLITAYGESFVDLMAATYAELGDLMARARYYARSIELQWVLLGLETGEDFWFTAHLGGARDVHA